MQTLLFPPFRGGPVWIWEQYGLYLDIKEFKRPDRRERHKAYGPPSLPNDFLLSGSTMVDTQSTAGEVETSQDSVFSAPLQSSQSRPGEAIAVQSPRPSVFSS